MSLCAPREHYMAEEEGELRDAIGDPPDREEMKKRPGYPEGGLLAPGPSESDDDDDDDDGDGGVEQQCRAGDSDREECGDALKGKRRKEAMEGSQGGQGERGGGGSGGGPGGDNGPNFAQWGWDMPGRVGSVRRCRCDVRLTPR